VIFSPCAEVKIHPRSILLQPFLWVFFKKTLLSSNSLRVDHAAWNIEAVGCTLHLESRLVAGPSLVWYIGTGWYLSQDIAPSFSFTVLLLTILGFLCLGWDIWQDWHWFRGQLEEAWGILGLMISGAWGYISSSTGILHRISSHQLLCSRHQDSKLVVPKQKFIMCARKILIVWHHYRWASKQRKNIVLNQYNISHVVEMTGPTSHEVNFALYMR